MVRPMPIHMGENYVMSAIPLAMGLFVSVSILVALCAKHARQVPRKTSNSDSQLMHKQLITAIGHNPAAVPDLVKESGKQSVSRVSGNKGGAHEGFGEGGLWQKAILMGDKCRPPDFSGVIYYDYSGNRIPEMPRSPRASPLRNFSFPVEKIDSSMC